MSQVVNQEYLAELRATFNQVSLPVIVCDYDGFMGERPVEERLAGHAELLVANEAAVRLFGAESEEHLRDAWNARPRNQQLDEQAITSFISGESAWTGEGSYETVSGDILAVSNSYQWSQKTGTLTVA